MILTFAFAFAACAPQGASQSQLSSGLPESSPIVGGKAVKAFSRESQYVVMIYGESVQGNPFVCTGSFLTTSTIITAAHCVVRDISKLTVVYGVDPFHEAEPIVLPLQSAVQHPSYREGSAIATERNDLALIRFSGGLPADARTVQLPKEKVSEGRSQNLLALGYGRTEGLEDKADDETGILRSVHLPVANFSSKSTALIVSQVNNRGVCSGDSGGPLFMTRTNSADYVLMGIASGVFNGAVPSKSDDPCKQYSVFMNVSAYLPWIQKNLY